MSHVRLPRAALTAAACLSVLTGISGLAAPSAFAAERPAAPQCGTPSSANGNYVQFIYGSVLGRCADAGGLAKHTTELDAGLERADFTEQVDLSQENLLDNNVVPTFQMYLGRAPKPAEARRWTAYIRAHQEDARLTANLVASREFFLKTRPLPKGCPGAEPMNRDVAGQTRNAVWVDNLFCTSLDRLPSAAESAQLTRNLQKRGSTVAIRRAQAFAVKRSRENAEGWVYGIFGAALHRAPESPTVAAKWVRHLMGEGEWRTFRLYTEFLASDEAFEGAQQPAGEGPK